MVYKDEARNTWYVRFKTKDTFGKTIEIWKRGFKTKHAASEYEAERRKIIAGSTSMSFENFCTQVFLPFCKLRVKDSTYNNYESILKKDLIPYFGALNLEDITPAQVVEWQDLRMNLQEKIKKASSLQNEHKILSMVFKHAMRYYGLARNPASVVGNFKNTEHKEMSFWTLEEYKKFASEIKDNPIYSVSFDCLYWLGLRRGELIALQKKDIDLEKKLVSITKTRYRAKGGIYRVTPPKTPQSKREVSIPAFLVDKLKAYMSTIPGLSDETFIFPVTGEGLKRFIEKNAKKAGIKAIRVHDLRHSHVSLLIQQGFSPLAIGKRVGHKSQEITYRYAHLYPQVQTDMAESLDALNSQDPTNIAS